MSSPNAACNERTARSTSSSATTHEIRIVEVETGHVRALSGTASTHEHAPQWTPAGDLIAHASELSEATRAALQAFFDQAQKRPDQDIRIEGNCDERGTREYNIALGQRRADTAKKYLENLGLDGSRIDAISNGKERPRAAGNDEASWKENRRDDLTPTTGKVADSSSADQASR